MKLALTKHILLTVYLVVQNLLCLLWLTNSGLPTCIYNRYLGQLKLISYRPSNCIHVPPNISILILALSISFVSSSFHFTVNSFLKKCIFLMSSFIFPVCLSLSHRLVINHDNLCYLLLKKGNGLFLASKLSDFFDLLQQSSTYTDSLRILFISLVHKSSKHDICAIIVL